MDATGLPLRVPTCGMGPVSFECAASKTCMISALPATAESGKTASDDLSERAEVGRHAIVLLRAAVREPEPRHDLVEYQGNAVLVRDVTQSFEEAGLRGDDALERLDDHAADLIMVLLDDGGRRFEIVEGRDEYLVLNGARDAGGIGLGAGKVDELGRREAHEGVFIHPVVAALELKNLVPSAVRPRRAHGEQGCLGPSAGKSHLLRCGHGAADLLCQGGSLLPSG